MIVICIEGSHASGKSTLCKQFEEANYLVLDEAFFTMPAYALHPQSLVMETLWVAKWVERLLKKQSELSGKGKNAIFIADRSPYSAVFYAQGGGGKLLQPVIDAMIAELAQNDIHIFTVYVQVNRDILWSRIQQRLLREPEREKYNENNRDWMEKTVAFYESRRWDYTVSNDDDDAIPNLMDKLLRMLSAALLDYDDMDEVRTELGLDSPPRAPRAARATVEAIPMSVF